MSPSRNESDSEDDPEYVPTADPGSNSDSSDGDDARKSKKRKISPEARPTLTAEEVEAKQRAQSNAWDAFQASASTFKGSSSATPPVKLVKIEKKHRFAGQEVIEVKEVPEDSDDARQWPRWRPPSPKSDNTSPLPVETRSSLIDVIVPASAPTPASTSEAALSPDAPPTPTPKPALRKPKRGLLDPSAMKPKKLSTLDKSAMDWRSHVESSGEVKDDLEAHRRSGGYLEKVDFLERVGERKELQREAGMSKRKRAL